MPQTTLSTLIRKILIELFGGDLEYGLDLGDAGVVDDHIEPAELFGGCVDSGNDLVALRHVRSDEDRFSAQLLDLGDDRITLSRCGSMSATAMSKPSAARRSAMPRPIPCPAPVTNATLS